MQKIACLQKIAHSSCGLYAENWETDVGEALVLKEDWKLRGFRGL